MNLLERDDPGSGVANVVEYAGNFGTLDEWRTTWSRVEKMITTAAFGKKYLGWRPEF